MRKSAFLTFCFSMIPGCGQMYQGYMRRGVSLLFWFFAVIGVSAVLHVGILCLLLPIIWAYSFFDSFNLRNLSDEQRAALGDFFIPCADWMQTIGLEKWAQKQSFGKIAGWGMMILGVLVLYGAFWDMISNFVWNLSPLLASWMHRLPSLIIAVGIILVGWRLLRPAQPAPTENNTMLEEGGGEDA